MSPLRLIWNQSPREQLRVYYVDGSNYIHELIGDTVSGEISWKAGGLTDMKYQIASGTGITASSGKNGTLRVFFIAQNSSTKITEAYFYDSENKWQSKVLK